MGMRPISSAAKFVPARQGEEVMGLTHVTAWVSNPADPTKKWQGLFLVDTGAVDSMVPTSALREIGMEPVTKRDCELADGSKIALSVGVGQIEFMGDIVGASIIFGPDDCEPILGVTALESTGIMVDSQNEPVKATACRASQVTCPAS